MTKNPNPSAIISDPATDSCENQTLNLDASGSTGSGLSYQWGGFPSSTISDTDAETTSAVPSNGSESGTVTFLQEYYLTVTNEHGCQDQDTMNIDIYETPVADTRVAASSPNGSPMCYGNGVIELDADYDTDSSSIGYYEYSWEPTDSIPGQETWETPEYKPGSNPGSAQESFYLKDTIFNMSNRNCYDVDSVEVIILRKPETGNQYYVPDDFDQ
jgi:hypothetical protein